MVLIIWYALIDVGVHLYQKMGLPFSMLFSVESLISILGDFLLVLIAIEIYLNIVFYLQEDAVHVTLVLATALTAVARKVIIVDYQTTNHLQLYAIAATVLAVG